MPYFLTPTPSTAPFQMGEEKEARPPWNQGRCSGHIVHGVVAPENIVAEGESGVRRVKG